MSARTSAHRAGRVAGRASLAAAIAGWALLACQGTQTAPPGTLDGAGAGGAAGFDAYERAIRLVPPTYPDEAIDDRVEGAAVIGFAIDEEGRPVDIEVLAWDGLPAFGPAAADAVKQWEFEPTLFEGRPVATYHNEVRIDFRVSDLGRTSPEDGAAEIRATLERALSALESGDFDEAERRLDEVPASQPPLIEIVAYLRAQIALHRADDASAYYYVRLATRAEGSNLVPAGRVAALAVRFSFEMEYGELPGALETFEVLAAQETRPDNWLEIQQSARVAEAVLLVGSVVTMEGTLARASMQGGPHAVWLRDLSRRSITLEPLEGHIERAEAICEFDADRHPIPLDGGALHLPEAWGPCKVRISGESGARFRVRQLASEDAAG